MSSQARNVLVVDDDDALAEMVAAYLTKQGYQCWTAPNPVLALKLLERQSIDVVITDLMMPYSDGISFTQQLRANPRFKNLPVILLTAYPSEELNEKGMRKGVAMTLEKPVNLSKLLDLVGFATH